MSMQTVADVEQALERYTAQAELMRGNYRLDRMRRLLTRLGDPQDKLRIVHVAGTSGKTSTAYYIRAMLEAAGCKTGLTVSPHIVSLKERAQIGAQGMSDEQFVSEFSEFLELVGQGPEVASYFELLVAFVYWECVRARVDYAVIEVGLGGLLDGTNTSKREDKLCVISDIGLDHTEILGDTIEEIAAQKAGIIQPHNHAIMLEQGQAVEAVISKVAKKQNGSLTIIKPSIDESLELPAFQRRNFALAGSAYEYLQQRDGLPELTQAQLQQASNAGPPARMEYFLIGDKQIVIDGAHNPQKLEALHRSLEERSLVPCTVIANLVEASEQKINDSLQEIALMASHLLIPEFVGSQDIFKKGVVPTELAERASTLNISSVEVVSDPQKALQKALDLPGDTILVTGSLYLASALRRAVTGYTK